MIQNIHKQFAMIGFLVTLNLVTAALMIQVAHQNRNLYLELEELQTEKDELDTRRGQLLLELGSLSAHGRIEREAREKLDMHPPPKDEILTLMIE